MNAERKVVILTAYCKRAKGRRGQIQGLVDLPVVPDEFGANEVKRRAGDIRHMCCMTAGGGTFLGCPRGCEIDAICNTTPEKILMELKSRQQYFPPEGTPKEL
ncbi:MAG: hypothetical protein UV61_C0019G0023 [Candidatus Gottesmanbacteria bacterium GW2011_GWB1_43_11]|uniref:Uncharacterized protein n=1 Tax=Candidatus Gottesmanbacteria bacterium GW2011_GWB1_43_11 TaxID=1618446 RepID=A0A0G1CIG1_9BACT|nr:MAG: hypothetical protein UV17_C0015G0017 [Candidatus Gottesmanbacteria bacterium GW2011_GWA1_42_26]KKS85259.1 MAG: hypothetical protein UV61_C0019G0023 [Candidatus Gottesmanbacteria bacterium GW2011_GWB1_43_11]OGG08805.1 MAG: hypothetical protein A2699_05815 [Candidatus Gottesmanbacteria bacterium RIFCSPHIGHO2_01_FULL_43_15]OGG28024.1 MAG: hypothetical protein A3A59_04695 [Candidatus Gottesmanbacteria bacterium RIFCSPLOWO2_01_FULL_42_10]HCM38225.1 hypothetical protein [Patescibacteria group